MLINEIASPRLSAALSHLNSSASLLFTSATLEQAGAVVGRIFKPCQVDLVDSGARADVRMHHIPMGDISLNRLRYNSRVDIAPCQLRDFFLVQMPLHGSASVTCNGQTTHSTPQLATVINPDDVTHMRWEPGNDQFLLRVSRPLLENTLMGQLGQTLSEPLRFDTGFRWQESPAWCALIGYLLECVSQGLDLDKHRLIRQQMEQLVATTLLHSQPHNYLQPAGQKRSAIRPAHVRRVQEYIDAHAHEPLSAETLAEIGGVSLRGLYAGFKNFLGISPMQYLRDIRMERVRAELLSGEIDNVTGVALRWGFAHMGRFSAEYKSRFGESPSQSMRKR
ncbi:AraC family transcriptional regulator [Shimwellia blattae]|uniref:Transcriptional regulator n=1 Tax=Shimwellia blattae (strain ATCC 29907 / DSM 4481 / JCM 1650 / NBRC 105725 / CDC 9005-74) TaxID=630626 RepID=I2BBF9_SHIBC|nr:AraC family transcriptional regulator [Shimwellia blattae]AFJ47863.1 transcriptional regulator [Shimwellia blattae DSM 4481 = NBRC 105725]GAB79566.1 putative AraC family transcriptional regulator [Shimwellia blattae DSM 4481 = NBRC 105725]VDY65362.1 Transcriptional activator feaR [Shimwellia blattae]VEC24347.1 Transcriptional activator feaR [Shimwellia blattae]